MRVLGFTIAIVVVLLADVTDISAQSRIGATLESSDKNIAQRAVDFYAVFMSAPTSLDVAVTAEFPDVVVALIAPSGRTFSDDSGSGRLQVGGEYGEWGLVVTSKRRGTVGDYRLIVDGSLRGPPEPRPGTKPVTDLITAYFNSIDRQPQAKSPALGGPGNSGGFGHSRQADEYHERADEAAKAKERQWENARQSAPPPAPRDSAPYMSAPPRMSAPPEMSPPPSESSDLSLPTPTPTPPPDLDAFWNSWVEELGHPSRDAVDVLEKGNDYRLFIDLAAIRYAEALGNPTGVRSSLASTPLLREIEKRISSGRTNLRLKLHVAALGSNLRIPDNQPLTVDVDLTKITNAPTPPTSVSRPSQLTNRFSAASIETDVHAVSAGCGAIVIFVTASDGIRPLDHLVQRVEIGDGNAATGRCGGESSFESGLSNLLALAGGPLGDVGLQIIETDLGNETLTAALLLDKSGDYWAWEMARSLSGYLGSKALLEASINRARAELTSSATLDYSDAGFELSRVIFSGKRRDQRKIAESALVALKKIVNVGPPPTVLIRAVDSDGHELFVPLSLITAKGSKSQFEGTLRVVHPLPHGESYETKGECVKEWKFAIPPNLGGSELPESLRNDSFWLHPGDETLDALRKFFSVDPESPETPRTEGLVLLAHHKSGSIWYQDGDSPILASDMNHDFGDGSVAVLLSCDVAAARESEMLLTRRLSTYGVDTLILSPFSLQSVYGRAFSIGFAEAVREARASRRAATILQLFEAASDKAATRLEEETARKYGGMELELIIAGDHSQKLCVEPNP